MAITLEDFQNAKPGDKFIDANGRPWEVIDKFPTEGSYPHLFVRLAGRKIEEIFFNTDDNQIMDEEWGNILELNHPDARFEPVKKIFSPGDRAEWSDEKKESVKKIYGLGPFTITDTEEDGQTVTIRNENTGTLTVGIPAIWLNIIM